MPEFAYFFCCKYIFPQLPKLCISWQDIIGRQVDKFWHSWEVMQLQTLRRQVCQDVERYYKEKHVKKHIMKQHLSCKHCDGRCGQDVETYYTEKHKYEEAHYEVTFELQTL